MEPTLMYAVTGGAVPVLLLLLHATVLLMRCLRPWLVLLRTHLVHALTVPPRQLPWSWTYGQVLLLLIYLAANIFCCCFNVSTVQGASTRAARLSFFNILPAYLGPHFSFLFDLSGVSLHTYRTFHGLTATMSFLLGLVHVVIDVVQRSTLKQNSSLGSYGTVVSHSPSKTLRYSPFIQTIAAMGVILVLSFLRSIIPIYEIFLRCHQILAIGVLYSLWKHVHSRSAYICLIAASCIFTSTLILGCLLVLYRSFSFSNGCSQALISRHNGVIRMTIFVTRPWKAKGGEYVNISIPSISLWSVPQSHPFMIASSSDGQNPSIDLIIEPQRGFTQKLFSLAEDYQKEQRVTGSMEQAFGFSRRHPGNPEAADYRRVILSGPHGQTHRYGDYDRALLFAEGLGIAALLQFLSELTHRFYDGQFRTRHVYMFWQLQHLGKYDPPLYV
jgi:hypothetical protein